jgi:signal transduction histidine kinase
MVERAVRELADDATAPDRRARLAAFVAAAFAADDLARRRMAAELEVGREAMAHVLEIIGEQQRRAHERAELEPCDVTDIVARHAAIARYAPGLSIAFSFPAVTHRVLASRVILSQVIGNLFGNAAEAIAATGRGGGSIGVTIGERDGRVVVTIRDDGEGFDAGRTALFFQRGFSTRGHKSGGLGLHWCANSMTAMGGSLDLRSPGSGMGAEAILTLDAVRVPVVLAA